MGPVRFWTVTAYTYQIYRNRGVIRQQRHIFLMNQYHSETALVFLVGNMWLCLGMSLVQFLRILSSVTFPVTDLKTVSIGHNVKKKR